MTRKMIAGLQTYIDFARNLQEVWKLFQVWYIDLRQCSHVRAWMITSTIKKQTSVCCSISLYPYMAFQTWNHGKKEKKKESLYCWCQLLDQSLLLYANIVFKGLKRIVKNSQLNLIFNNSWKNKFKYHNNKKRYPEYRPAIRFSTYVMLFNDIVVLIIWAKNLGLDLRVNSRDHDRLYWLV